MFIYIMLKIATDIFSQTVYMIIFPKKIPIFELSEESVLYCDFFSKSDFGH